MVTLSDGRVLNVNTCVRAAVVEVNERLVSEPELMSRDPSGAGHVCVLLPKLPAGESIRDACHAFSVAEALRAPVQASTARDSVLPQGEAASCPDGSKKRQGGGETQH